MSSLRHYRTPIRQKYLLFPAVAIRRMLEPVEKEAAKERMSEGGRGGNLPPLERGKTRDKVAAFTGVSGRTLDKADALVSTDLPESGLGFRR